VPQSAPVKDLYRLQESHRIHLRIHYPTDLDNIILRTDLDWNRDVLPSRIDRDQSFAEFQFETSQPFV
jgi:hypothetical protein